MFLPLTHTDKTGRKIVSPDPKKTGVLLANLGSPAEPTIPAVRRFLKDFLPADKMICDILKEKGDIQEMPPALEKYDFEVNTVLSEGEKIELGEGIVWTVFNTPGHSPC